MATLYYIKKSGKDCVVKVSGVPGVVTIPLVDLLTTKQAVMAGKDLEVNLNEFYWSCDNNGKVIISRNGVEITRFHENGSLNFGAGFVDNVENTKDISVEIVGAECHLWMKVVKHNYANMIEEAAYSIYDNKDAVGE